MRRRQIPGDAPAHGMPGNDDLLHPELVHYRDDAGHICRVRVILIHRRAAQPEAGNVYAQHPQVFFQRRRPIVPGLQTRAKAVQQQDGRCFPQAAVLHKHRLLLHHEPRRAGAAIALQQYLFGFVRGPGQPDRQRKQKSNHEQNFHWVVNTVKTPV